ncbi:MAG: hypothetical protein WC289_06140 [Patescibacteria group bacterium]|jgi:hypothetical protein
MSGFFPFWLAAYQSPSRLSKTVAIIVAAVITANAVGFSAVILGSLGR